MKSFQIAKATSPLSHLGLKLVGDKSLAHRAMLLGALAEGKSQVTNFPSSGVSFAMMRCLRELGVDVSIDGESMTIVGNGLKAFNNSCKKLDCGNSATTMRLLIGALFGTKTQAIVDGTDSLRRRPIRVDQFLKRIGFTNFTTSEGHLTMHIGKFTDKIPRQLPTIETCCNSAQLKSAIMLVALGLKRKLVLREPLKTRDHTERMLKFMGADVSWNKDGRSEANMVCMGPLLEPLAPLQGRMPGDISSSAFMLAAAALVPSSEVTIADVLLNETRTGFLDVLMRMGCSVQTKITGSWCGETFGQITLKSPAVLKQVDISDPQQVVNMIDEFPAIAALMAAANGISTVRNAAELRFKESDRIASILHAYQQLGLQIHEYEDGFSVNGSRSLHANAPISTFNDHRIAMAFSLLGLVGDVAIDDCDIVNESFPSFFETIDNLRT